MKALIEEIRSSAAFLESRGIEHPRKEVEELLAQVLGVHRLDLYLMTERVPTPSELSAFKALVERRGNREPLQHITGTVEFFHCTLKIDSRALIPRPETEELVENIVEEIGDKPGVFYDVCCGTGCIAIAVKKACPQLEVYASDIDEDALRLAQENAALNDVQVMFMQGDLCQPFFGKHCDYLVSNPPYIETADIQALQPEVRQYEPRRALDGGTDGLDFYRRLQQEVPAILKSKGRVWLEIGHGQGEGLLQLFNALPWKERHLGKDRAGRERFIFLVNE